MKPGPGRGTASAGLPTRHGAFRVMAFSRDLVSKDHLALIKGDVEGREEVPVRLHSECVTGDVLGSRRCDCRAQLEGAIDFIEKAGFGVLIYLRQEGRGIGLFNKIRAYRLQELGRDTIEANEELGFDADQRSWKEAAAILRLCGVSTVRVITNNRLKIDGLRREGIDVRGRIPIIIPPDDFNAPYLRTKADRMGHMLDEQDEDRGLSVRVTGGDPAAPRAGACGSGDGN